MTPSTCCGSLLDREKFSHKRHGILLPAEVIPETLGDVAPGDLADGSAAAFQHDQACLLQAIVAKVNTEPAGDFAKLTRSFQ